MKDDDFTDFEEFRSTIQQLDGEWLLNGGNDWHWHCTALKLAECEVQVCYSHSGLITEGISSSDGYSFYIPFKNHVWRHCGCKLDTDDIMVMEPGAEYTVTSKVADGWHSFYVPKQLLECHTRREGGARSYLISHQQQRADRIRDLFHRVIAAVGENPSIEFSPAARMMAADLLSLLEPALLTTEGGVVPRGRPRLSRREIIDRSKAALEGRSGEPIHVSDLAKNLGVCERTLRTAFNDYYQIGPREYLHLRQLHAVHRDLIDSDPEEKSVTDILTRWGVWEFGRFAGKYRLHFGELPNETLRRRARVTV